MNYKGVWGVAGIALASMAGLSVAAQAADLGKRKSHREEPAYSAPGNWAGGYIGGHLGASWISGSADLTADYYEAVESTTTYDKWDFIGEPYRRTGHTDVTEGSFLGGVHGGYNFQTGAFVYGFEGDIGFGGNIDYLASLRGRFGVAANNWLFYGTAGLALAETNLAISVSDGNVRQDYDFGDSQVGFVVGGGAEFKLSPKWSIGVEGLYYGFDGYSASQSFYDAGYYGEGGRGEGVAATSTASGGADVGVVRARLNYHLGRGYEPLR